MKIAKILGIVFMTLGLSQCGTVKFDKTPPFKVMEATYNNWVGGQPGVSGTKVTVMYQSTSKVTFESIYFKNRKTKAEQYSKNDKTYLIGHFSTSDRSDLILDIDTKKELNNKIPEASKLPFEMKENEIVLSYYEKGKLKYHKIVSVTQGDTDYYR